MTTVRVLYTQLLALRAEIPRHDKVIADKQAYREERAAILAETEKDFQTLLTARGLTEKAFAAQIAKEDAPKELVAPAPQESAPPQDEKPDTP